MVVIVVMSLGEVGNKPETANYFFHFKFWIPICNAVVLNIYGILIHVFTYRKSIIGNTRYEN